MALDPKKWTVKTQEAFAAAIDQAKANANPELTPDHLLAALTRQDDTIVAPVLAKLGQAPLHGPQPRRRGRRQAAQGRTAATSRAWPRAQQRRSTRAEQYRKDLQGRLPVGRAPAAGR